MSAFFGVRTVSANTHPCYVIAWTQTTGNLMNVILWCTPTFKAYALFGTQCCTMNFIQDKLLAELPSMIIIV